MHDHRTEIIDLKRRVHALEQLVKTLLPQQEHERDEADEELFAMHAVDESIDLFRIKRDLLRAMNATSVQYLEFTFGNYPHVAKNKVYQNHLMQDVKMTDKARKQLAKTRLLLAQEASVGDEFECPGCSSKVIKRTYQHKFCDHKITGQSNCKDFINNWFNTKRLERTLKWLEN